MQKSILWLEMADDCVSASVAPATSDKRPQDYVDLNHYSWTCSNNTHINTPSHTQHEQTTSKNKQSYLCHSVFSFQLITLQLMKLNSWHRNQACLTSDLLSAMISLKSLFFTHFVCISSNKRSCGCHGPCERLSPRAMMSTSHPGGQQRGQLIHPYFQTELSPLARLSSCSTIDLTPSTIVSCVCLLQ